MWYVIKYPDGIYWPPGQTEKEHYVDRGAAQTMADVFNMRDYGRIDVVKYE